jgi:hypothetical protein
VRRRRPYGLVFLVLAPVSFSVVIMPAKPVRNEPLVLHLELIVKHVRILPRGRAFAFEQRVSIHRAETLGLHSPPQLPAAGNNVSSPGTAPNTHTYAH